MDKRDMLSKRFKSCFVIETFVWSVKYVQHLRRLNSNLGSASKDFNIETLLAFYRLTKCNKPQVCGTSFKGHWICSEEILDL